MLLLSSAVLAQTTIDPLILGVGARALGMGRAFVAVAEDADTIFTNPAGLGEIDGFEFTSMSGAPLEDLKYTTLGGVYPLGDKSAFGLGYACAGVSAIEIRDSQGTLTGRTNFENNLYFASYGRKISEKLSLGLNLKYFSQNAHDQTDANGTGWNLDIGLLQKGLGWFSLGLVGQNILSSGKINYKNATATPLPLTIKLGTRMSLAGERFESAILAPYELFAVADADLSLSAGEPTTTHLGLEFSPNNYLTLRCGMDQDPLLPGIQTNFTGGISLRWAGIGFNYAYHPYTDIGENAAQYFSLTLSERDWPVDLFPDFLLGAAPQQLLGCQKVASVVK